MQTLHTTEFHRLLGTPVRLDLGQTNGLLADIKFQVKKLDTVAPATDRLPAIDYAATVELPKQITDLAGQGATQNSQVLAHLGTPTVSLLADLKQALTDSADDIVTRLSPAPVPIPAPVPAPHSFVVGEQAVHLVRLLVQVAALALDKSPGEPSSPKKTDWKENVAIDALRNAATTAIADANLTNTPLGHRVLDAFNCFKATDLPSRSSRFVEAHALMQDVACTLSRGSAAETPLHRS